MNSIFDIEEKSNKKIDKDYLISNGWELKSAIRFGDVYIKTIYHKNLPSRCIKFCYYYTTFTQPVLRNMNKWKSVEVCNITDLEIMVNKWTTDWEKSVTFWE